MSVPDQGIALVLSFEIERRLCGAVRLIFELMEKL